VARFRRVFHQLLSTGIYMAPSAFEAGFMSAAHGDAEITLTLERFDAALADTRD
jgi:glutamate-1-semialdehyde 2,1-aminomutase